ncbi:MAG: hypothetical protein IMZ53_14640 [Thermoplasmata archaeon]|nr:hypothetical protein [Thermoplasmata archaeon]
MEVIVKKSYCLCGCGAEINPNQIHGRIKKFVSGHNAKLQKINWRFFRCPQCGKEFKKRPSHLTTKTKKRFCSRSCSSKYNCAKFVKDGADRSRNPNSKFTTNCSTCGKEITRYKSAHPLTKRHICSQKCLRMSDATRKRMSDTHKRMVKTHGAFLLSKPHKLFMDLFLNKFGVMLQKEFHLVNDDGCIKYYDCKVPDKNILFEIDGLYWHSLPSARINDAIKDKLAERLGYKLYRVPEDRVIEFINTYSINNEPSGSENKTITLLENGNA